MKRIFKLLISGRFWLNAALIAVVLFIAVKLVFYFLGVYTRHGESVTVPNLQGYSVDKIETILANVDMTYEITDSIYTDKFARGVVVAQNPNANKQVKKGRTIFLTVNRILPEMVSMPDLVGKSRRIALPLIEIAGLKLKALEYRPDNSCTDCVLDVEHAGQTIKAGTPIRKGEEVTIILGRQSEVTTLVPLIIGKTYPEAVEILNTQSLNMGQILSCKGCLNFEDSASAYINAQIPSGGAQINLGSYVDVYLTVDSINVTPPQMGGNSTRDESF